MEGFAYINQGASVNRLNGVEEIAYGYGTAP